MTTAFAIVEDNFQGGKRKKKKKIDQRSEIGEQLSIPLFEFLQISA